MPVGEIRKGFTEDIADEINPEGWVNYQWKNGENILAKGNGISKIPGLEEHKEE